MVVIAFNLAALSEYINRVPAALHQLTLLTHISSARGDNKRDRAIDVGGYAVRWVPARAGCEEH